MDEVAHRERGIELRNSVLEGISKIELSLVELDEQEESLRQMRLNANTMLSDLKRMLEDLP